MKKLTKKDERGNFKILLRELRERAGLSQGKVSKALGYTSAQFVSNWERGISEPPIETLGALSKLYNVSIEDLYESYVQFKLQQLEKDLRAKIPSGRSR